MTAKTFAELKKILNEIWQSPFSDFYRRHFAKHGFNPEALKNPADWQKVPFLSRSDLQKTDLFERLFDDWGNLIALRVSSGTTSSKFLVVPRTNYPDEDRAEALSNIGVKGLLSLSQYHRSYNGKKMLGKRKVVLMSGDVHDLKRSAAIFKKLKLDSIVAAPSILILCHPFLKETNALFQIKALLTEGEYCTPFQWQKIRRIYPKVKLLQFYGLTETDGFFVGLPRLNENAAGPNHYRLAANKFFLEITKPDSEITLTSLSRSLALPLIRYRTGDMGLISGRSAFKVLGRINFDVLRLNGCEFRADNIEEAVARTFNIENPRFEMHFFEDYGSHHLLLRIYAAEKTLNITPFKRLALLRYIRGGPTLNLERALNNNLFHYFKIEVADECPSDKKLRRLQLHETAL